MSPARQWSRLQVTPDAIQLTAVESSGRLSPSLGSNTVAAVVLTYFPRGVLLQSRRSNRFRDVQLFPDVLREVLAR